MGEPTQLTGNLLIGASEVRGTGNKAFATDPATGQRLEPSFGGATLADVDRACSLAARDFDAFRSVSLERRAQLLEVIAESLMDLGDTLVDRAAAESGLPRVRIEGERGRTCGQLRLFANVVREGRWLDLTVDTAQPDRTPIPRPDLRSRRIPVGPVAVFGASNFPLAFCVAGGDTASALAAGCPVIAKSHPSHLGTSELAGRAIQRALNVCGLPEGAFSLVTGVGNEVGGALVRHPAVQAVGFTGSRRGGQALIAIAAERPHPIPVFAEMSSVNPVFLLPEALATRTESIAQGLTASVTLGVGQFCTKPGLVFAVEGEGFERFCHAAALAIAAAPANTMLHTGIQQAYTHALTAQESAPGVERLATGADAQNACAGQAVLLRTTGKVFRASPALADEVFGPAALLVACKDIDEMTNIAAELEGQLTATLHANAADYGTARQFMAILERKAGRLVLNGFPTGVEVSHAMVHGGPFPSTSDSRATSVGTRAIGRFLRPVCYQGFPSELLPQELSEQHLPSHPHLLNGIMRTKA